MKYPDLADNMKLKPKRLRKINIRRADRADEAIAAYWGDDNEDEPRNYILSDLLCDLRHWADREGIDFDAELARSAYHHEAEQTED